MVSALPSWPRLLSLAAGALAAALLLVSFGFATLKPVRVVPRQELAPGWVLHGPDGGRMSSEALRGRIAVYTFAPLDCGARCAAMDSALAELSRRLASDPIEGVDPALVTIALDPGPSAERLAAAGERRGADGTVWRFTGGDAAAVERTVRTGFRVWYEAGPDGSWRFDPAFILVDGTGLVRARYRFGTPPVEYLLEDMRLIAREARASGGFARYAYEAAHLFGCFSR
jgi:cytochrome oxidase Cu insertion factor (SCO1/SenC/PrrC family)